MPSQYTPNNQPLNLASMHMDTISKAFSKYHDQPTVFIAGKLGLRPRTLYSWCKDYRLNMKELRRIGKLVNNNK